MFRFLIYVIKRIHDLQPTATIKKKLTDGFSIQDIENYRNSWDSKLLAEIQRNHLFFYFIGTLRSLGYNEYKIKSGELMTVDLDRACFTKLDSHYDINKLTLCYICKIDQKTLETLQDAVEEKTLSTTLQHSLLFDDFQITFSKSEAKRLQIRVTEYLENCFDTCVLKYGLQNVILPNEK